MMFATLVAVATLVAFGWFVYDMQAWLESNDYRKHFED